MIEKKMLTETSPAQMLGEKEQNERRENTV